MTSDLPLVIAEGDPYERGFTHGKTASKMVRGNVLSFWSDVEALGISRGSIANLLDTLPANSFLEEDRAYLSGLSAGSGVKSQDILALNYCRHLISPDECTVMIGFKDATASGTTIVLKNSDKVGGAKFVGSNFHLHKEINIVLLERASDGEEILAVAAAGENAIKMGMNSAGVAVGTNIARTKELRERKVNLDQMRASDRLWLAKDALLKHRNALSATRDIFGRVLENPMSTPGNIEFVDSNETYVIEGSYDRSATSKHTSGVLARANRFVLLSELNDPLDESSRLRQERATELLESHLGKLTTDDMIGFSQDHTNGPGLNSLCRHSEDYNDETSLSAAVMDIHANPRKSVFHVILGKPCHSWKNNDARVSVGFEPETRNIPEGFTTGSVFKQFYSETLV